MNSGSFIYAALANATGGANPLPVELASFTASAKSGMVELAWRTATETNNAGFDVQKRAGDAWTSVGFVAGAGTSNAPKSYSFVDRNVETGVTSYRLKQTDRDGKVSYSNTVEVNAVGAPTVLALNGNYPNPFNPATTISFTVPSDGMAVVKVFDILGKEVATVFSGAALSGKRYAAPFDATALPSGVYFSQLEFGGQRLVKRMMLLK